ncbi:MAG: outer membrane beta-barrel protein [Campylobacterota bacterium]|nr:outer membrane beta-barrel protein [Campylobacterota bacterium]
MKLIKIITLILLFFTSLYASSTSGYILITKTSKASNLKHIKKKLDSLNVKMFTQKSGKYHMVYSQKYNNRASLENAYKRVKQSFHTATIVTKKRPKKAVTGASQTAPLHSLTLESNKNDMFVSLGLGSSGIYGSTDDAGVAKLNTAGLSLFLEAGYYFSENIFLSLAYLNTSTSDITMHNAYSSFNYQLNFLEDFSLYGGVLVGLGTLQLSAYDASEPSISIIYGGQAGLEYNILGDIALYTSAQMLFSDHNIKLLDTATQATFSSINNLQLGVRYRF